MSQNEKQDISLPEIPKENAFNAIRLLLCFVVIFMHCFNRIGISNKYLLDGHMAVCGFFIISGFWVTKSYFSSKNIGEFILKRIKKLLPMYYISVIGFSLLCFHFSDLTVKEYFGLEYWKYLFWNCIFLNFVHPSLPGCFSGDAVNGALWTIKIEIGFYILLPIILFFWREIKTLSRKNVFLISLYVLSILYNILLTKFSKQLHLPSQLAHQLPGFISFFISGMLIYFNWNTFLKLKNCLIVPAIGIYILHYVTNTEILFPIALAIILVFFAVQLKFLKCIGDSIDFSWGLYLTHFPLMQIMYSLGIANIDAFVYVSSVAGIGFTLTFVTEKYIQKKIK